MALKEEIASFLKIADDYLEMNEKEAQMISIMAQLRERTKTTSGKNRPGTADVSTQTGKDESTVYLHLWS